MKTAVLRRYIEPLLDPRLESVRSIRLGTKSLSYWPYRFLSDPDSDELLRLFERVRATGRHLAVMAHYSHPRELETSEARRALKRVVDTGAAVRCQAPLIRHVNDSATIWAELWQTEVELGAVPYYMFVERDTGPKHYFEVPLARALRIFSDAHSRVSGLARTVRGPSMSASPGKVSIEGTTVIDHEKLFVLKMLQGRDPTWVNRVFFARFDSQATWLDELEPGLGERRFFYSDAMDAMARGLWRPSWDNEEELSSAGIVGEGA
jgi:L-lysine 2,3-aminomutase